MVVLPVVELTTKGKVPAGLFSFIQRMRQQFAFRLCNDIFLKTALVHRRAGKTAKIHIAAIGRSKKAICSISFTSG
jgi:hypothetical protein